MNKTTKDTASPTTIIIKAEYIVHDLYVMGWELIFSMMKTNEDMASPTPRVIIAEKHIYTGCLKKSLALEKQSNVTLFFRHPVCFFINGLKLRIS